MSYIKRFESYKTWRSIIGNNCKDGGTSVTKKILGLIMEVIYVIAEYFSTDFAKHLTDVINTT